MDEIRKPTPEEEREAERLLKDAWLAEKKGLEDKRKEAILAARKIAPDHPDVLVAEADVHAERSRWATARDLYARALKIAPDRVEFERKHAEAILKAEEVADPLAFMERSESAIPMASAKFALLYSFVLPGLGHLSLGMRKKGAWLLAMWVLGWLFAFTVPNGMSQLIGLGGSVNGWVFLPLAFAAVAWILAVVEISTLAKTSETRKIERPKPPVDMDF